MKNNNEENKQAISINIAIENVKSQISTIILNSGIPASVLELIMKDLYIQTRDAAAQVYQNEIIEYEASLKASTEQNTD